MNDNPNHRLDAPPDPDLFDEYMTEVTDSSPVISFPPSVQRHLDEAAAAHRQALASGSGLLQAGATELARSSPEMFGFSIVLQSGGTGLTFDEQVVETHTVTDELRVLGVRIASGVRTETTTIAKRRAIRREP